MVVLGLVSSKTPVLEPVEVLARRIDEAAKFVDLGQLALSRNAASPRSRTAGTC
jgi:5-methyltetrahydropteroyltriglutamate--homocysteine methyltransferase